MSMTETSIITHSSDIETQLNEFALDYPMGSYIPVWKIFRAFSKENDLIASHVRSLEIWKKYAHLPIV